MERVPTINLDDANIYHSSVKSHLTHLYQIPLWSILILNLPRDPGEPTIPPTQLLPCPTFEFVWNIVSFGDMFALLGDLSTSYLYHNWLENELISIKCSLQLLNFRQLSIIEVKAFSPKSFAVSQLKRWSTGAAICASREHHIAVKSEIVECIWSSAMLWSVHWRMQGWMYWDAGRGIGRSNHYLPAHPLHSEGQMTHSNRFPWGRAATQIDEIY